MNPLRLAETALAVLAAAGAAGAWLAVRFMRGDAGPPPRAIPPAHGVLGAAGLAVLGVALFRGLPPSAMGTSGFGGIAGVLLGLALAFGLGIAWGSRKARRPAGAAVAVHAGLAIAGLVVLWALVSLA